MKEQVIYQDRLCEYNLTKPSEQEKRIEMLKEMPGVTIGDNAVIGAGSVVTKDIPANVAAVGNPCRVMREISEQDRKYYYKDREIEAALLGEK